MYSATNKTLANPSANIIVCGEILNTFLNSVTSKGCSQSPCTGESGHCTETRKETEGMKIEKEEVKLSLLTNNISSVQKSRRNL